MEQDSQETDDDDYHGTTNGTSLYRKTLGIAPGIENATCETGQGIDVTTENKRDFVYQDIAQDTSCRTSQHTHGTGRPEREIGIQSALYAYDGEQSQSNGVEQKNGIGNAVDVSALSLQPKGDVSRPNSKHN